MLPSTRPRTASEASPAVTRPSPLRSRPLFHWYSMLPLDHRVELGSDFGEPYSTEVYTPSSVDRLPLPAPARSMKYCSTYCSCSTELICANAAVLVPRPRSEEHTSELQSLIRISYAVIRLKKKKYSTYTRHY